MKKLDDRIYLVEENETRERGITIRMIDDNTYEVKSEKVDEKWSTYDSKTLNKIQKGLYLVNKAKCYMKGNMTDALMFAYTLRAVL